jgi:hypothetical protein
MAGDGSMCSAAKRFRDPGGEPVATRDAGELIRRLLVEPVDPACDRGEGGRE